MLFNSGIILLLSVDKTCKTCPVNKRPDGRPTPQDFMRYLPIYLKDNPGTKCAKGLVRPRPPY